MEAQVDGLVCELCGVMEEVGVVEGRLEYEGCERKRKARRGCLNHEGGEGEGRARKNGR